MPGHAESAWHPAGGASPAASCKPLVIVIENTEAADLSTLQDLILVLSEVTRSLRSFRLVIPYQGWCAMQNTLQVHLMLAHT